MLFGSALVEDLIRLPEDWFQQGLPFSDVFRKPPTESRIVIVGLDDWTMKASGGDWPIPRRIVGDLITKIAKRKPRVIAVDLTFAGSSRYGRQDDRALEDAMVKADCVVIGAEIAWDGSAYQESFLLPNDSIMRAAKGVGHGNAQAVRGVVRYVLPVWKFRGRSINSLALETARVASLRRGPAVRIGRAGIQIGENYLRRNVSGGMVITFRGPAHTFPIVSAQDVLQGRVRSDMFSDSYVLIGVTAIECGDIREVPVKASTRPRGVSTFHWMHGVEIHANALQTIIAVSEDPGGVDSLLYVCLFSLGVGWCAFRASSFFRAIAFSCGLMMTEMLAAAIAFWRWNIVVDQTIAIASALLTSVVVVAVRLAVAIGQGQQRSDASPE